MTSVFSETAQMTLSIGRPGEAVLLLARGRGLRGCAGQRPPGEEPAWPQDRRRRRDLACPARRPWPGPRLVRPAGADPAPARPDPNPHRHHPGTQPGDPTPGEALGG